MSRQVKKEENLARQSVIPLYYQLKQIFRSWIVSGKFDSDGRFPSESQLQKQYNVSRMTVRRALSELVNEGFLVREQGRGSFVVKQRFHDQLAQLTSFTEDMRLRNVSAKSEIKTFEVTRSSEVAARTGLSSDDELVKLKRVRWFGEERIAIQTAFLPHKLCPKLVEEGLIDGSLYRTLEERYHLHLGQAEQSVMAKPADKHEAELLGIEIGHSVLAIERLTRLQDNSVIEYVQSSYRGDRYAFNVILARHKL
ncbi:MAG: GntR family transcriptional regulator [candidate division WOR-3 bacterium]|nr:GntR family transcriptional regulator [candidate division WOR-3 bacterium]